MSKTAILCALAFGALSAHAEDYVLGPDSQRQPGVPQGKVTKHQWTSKIYPGTVRDYWVYVPAQYKPGKPACTMVFQDGGTFVNETGAFRTTIVFDNLIHKGELPVIIGVFINPGVLAAEVNDGQGRFNRSYEYDAIGERFPRYLLEEVLPEVAKSYNLSTNPDDRAISGSSSGGNGSFNAGWMGNHGFHRVLSFIGGFTNLRGDHIYPSLVRKMETKPLRVFLQDGEKDVNIYSNYELGAALRDAGYDYKLVIGTEGHNSKHGSAILPDALRWLWRDYPTPIAKPVNGTRHFLTNNVLYPDKDWELVGSGYKSAGSLAADNEGNVYFTDAPSNRIHKVGVDGKVSVFKENTGGATALMFGPDGRLYASQPARRKIVAFAPDGRETTVISDVTATDLAIDGKQQIFFTDSANKQLWYVDPNGNKRIAATGIAEPFGVRFSPDHAFLMVSDSAGRDIWSYLVKPNGTLNYGVPFLRLELPGEVESTQLRSGAMGMAVDSDGFLYTATLLGVQIIDPPGKTVGILNKPGGNVPTHLTFGGPDFKALYASAAGKVYRRSIKRQGTRTSVVVKTAKPRL